MTLNSEERELLDWLDEQGYISQEELADKIRDIEGLSADVNVFEYDTMIDTEFNITGVTGIMEDGVPKIPARDYYHAIKHGQPLD